MEIIKHTFDFQMPPSAVMLGKFDGIHLGHQGLLKRMQEENLPYKRGMITFDFTTAEVRHSVSLFTEKEREYLAEQRNIDWIVSLPFIDELRCMSPEDFFEKILLNKCCGKAVYVGADYHFGYKRAGDVAMLTELCRKHNIHLSVVEEICYESDKISSSRLRELVQSGRVEDIPVMLGYPYFVMGTVVSGRRLGRTIGFPTANIICSPEKILPKIGVYDTYNIINGQGYWGITNVGNNPTVSQNENHITVETHLLDFDEDIYEKEIITYFVAWNREQVKFSSLEHLKKQLLTDKDRLRSRTAEYYESIKEISQ